MPYLIWQKPSLMIFHTYTLEWQEGSFVGMLRLFVCYTMQSEVRYNKQGESSRFGSSWWFSEFFDISTGKT